MAALYGDAAKVSKIIQSSGKSASQADAAVRSVLSSRSSGSSSGSSSKTPYAGGATGTDAFNKAFAGLSAQEQANYLSKGAGINVGGVNTTFAPSNVQSNARSVATNYNTPVKTAELTSAAVDNKTVPPPAPDYSGYAAGANALIKTQAEGEKKMATLEAKPANSLEQLISDYAAKTQPERLVVPEQLKQQEAAALAMKNSLASQIGMISATRDAQIESERMRAGQEGGTVAGVGSREAQINREAAVRLMPLTAQYQAAAQDYQAAKDTVSEWVAQENAYLNRLQSYQNNIFEKAFSYASDKEKTALEEARYQQNSAISMKKEHNSRIDDYYGLAAKNGDASTMSKIANLNKYVGTPEFDTMFANAISGMKTDIGGVGTSGMTAGQISAFNTLINAKNKSPLIAAADRVPILQDSINKVKANPSDGALQLNLTYSYIQALDTYQSAVREGELGLVNSIDSKIGQIQNYVTQIQNGQIVRPEVAKQLASAAENIVNTINNAAREKEKSFESQANVIGLGQQYAQYKSGFNSSYDAQTQNQTSSKFQDLLPSITVDSAKNTAYMPYEKWTSLDAQTQKELEAEAKADGFTLLFK